MARIIAFGLVRLALVAMAGAGAQPASLVDEGTFVITRAGAPVGTEAFKILRRSTPDGVEYLAQGTRTIEGSVVKSSLTTDSTGSGTSYSRTATGGSLSQLTARRAGGRLTVDETGGRASTKDFLFSAGSLILDDDLVHQLYFVILRQAGGPVGYVAPASRAAGEATLVEIGRGSVAIGKTTVPAAHLVWGTGIDRREIWIDSSRRLLKVSIPSQHIEATREPLPQ